MTPAEFLKRRWVSDGAMATYLFSQGAEGPVEELNLTAPELVAAVHREYLEAGAQILRTNTFTAGPASAAGVDIARRVAQGRALVAGVIGSRIHGVREQFREHAESLLGVDLVILETFRSIAELRAAVTGVRDAVGYTIPLVAQLSADADGGFPDGLHELDADVVGFNCSFGPESVQFALERLRCITNRPLSAIPSAGVGTMLAPQEMARYTRGFLANGAVLVGTCCGSTPEHIRAIACEHATLDSQWPPT